MRQPGAQSRRCRILASALIFGWALEASAAEPQDDRTAAEPWTAPPRLVIPTADLEASARFYRERLGFRIVSVADGWVVLRAGSSTIVLERKTQTGLEAHPHMEYFMRPAVRVNARSQDGPPTSVALQAVGKGEQWTDPAGLVSVKRAHRARTVRVAIDNLGESQSVRTPAGNVTARETSFGVLFEPQLSGMPPGLHSFHLHQNPSCDGEQADGVWIPGAAAGGHYDPDNAGFHGHPYGYGHLGDLPDIYVNPKGEARMPVLAPRLVFEDLAGHSLMIHAEGEHDPAHHAATGDNPRMACGVVSSAGQGARSSVGSP